MLTVIANTYWASRQAISSTNQAVSAVSVIDDEKIGSQEDLRDAIGRMKRLLALNHFALYSANGGNISETELGTLIGTDNIFDATKGNVSEEEWNAFRDDFAKGKKGTLTFTINDVVDTICYQSVPRILLLTACR